MTNEEWDAVWEAVERARAARVAAETEAAWAHHERGIGFDDRPVSGNGYQIPPLPDPYPEDAEFLNG